jgi:CheY-like chemotaxis protein
MNEKGILGVSLKQKVLGEKEIYHRPDMEPGVYVELSVSDTGTGIDPATIERVFDPFFTTKEVGEGTGMGLSMVHGIVMSHHGMITVDSEPGKGSTFHIYFPVVKSEDVEPEENQLPLPTGTERILLVDDEEGITELGRSILELQGFNVTTRASGIEALAYVKSAPDEIDLVITDQSMPEMSGTELTAEIKKIRADIPVILCTGYSQKVSSEEEAKAFGIKRLIMKPLDRQELVDIVRKTLDEKQGA